jgi:hypothetical protein
MVLDAGVFSTSAITSTFTAALRISQAVYELKAVGEQTRDLLDTTKYVNASLESVRELRRKKSDLLNREEKSWMDQQIEFTQKAVDSVAVLIERARVDMQAKNVTGNEDDYKSKHIKIHHRARFVLQESPKVLTNLSKVTMAMNGLNSVMVTLSSREGHSNQLQAPRGGNSRNRSPSGKAPPPYAERDFLNRRRTVNKSMQKREDPRQSDYLVPGDQDSTQSFGSQTVPVGTLHPRASMSSISPSINFTSTEDDPYYEHAIANETISPPACLPTKYISDSVDPNEYFGPGPYEMNDIASPSTTASESISPLPTPQSPPPNIYELSATSLGPPPDIYEMDASEPRNHLRTWNTTPGRIPTIARKPLDHQHQQQRHNHRASNPSITSIHNEWEQHLPPNPRTSSSSSSFSIPPSNPNLHFHSQYPPLASSTHQQKALPMLPLNVNPTPTPTPHHHHHASTSSSSSSTIDPRASVSSLNSTLSDPSSNNSSNSNNNNIPSISRGRSWLMDRAMGNVSPMSMSMSRAQSSASGVGVGGFQQNQNQNQNPYSYHGPDDFRRLSGGRG